jgi:hypothetical protein
MFSKRTVRLFIASMASLAGALALSLTPALAAAPEAPEVRVEGVRATEATFAGVLNPGASVEQEAGTYKFVYKPGSKCEGGVETGTGVAFGLPHEELPGEPVASLAEGIEYTVCLVEKTAGGEATATAHFTTAISPETPTEGVTGVTDATATLTGILNPRSQGEPGIYEFRYRQSSTECQGEGEVTSAGAATGESPEPVEVSVAELLPGMPYAFCLRAVNEAGEEAQGSPMTFTTAAATPTVANELVSDVEATTARVEAEIDPGSPETTYYVEYGPTESYDDATAPSVVGSNDSVHSVRVTLTGLAPGTTYHYSVVASNSASPTGVAGPDKIFTASEAAGATAETCPNAARRSEQPFARDLPNCRAYEMVSPAETNGQDATDAEIQSGARASEEDHAPREEPAIAYASRGAFGNPTGANLESYVVSRREPDGWATQAISPLYEPVLGEQVNSYKALAFTPELTEGVAGSNAALPGTEAPPNPFNGGGAREQDLYLADFATGSYSYVGRGIDPMGASTDLSHVVFGEHGTVSEWVNGRLVPVSIGNEGEAIDASVGNQAESELSAGSKDTWHAVSANGSRVFFTSPSLGDEEGSPQLYVRVNAEEEQSPPEAGGCTVSSLACTVSIAEGARFWGANNEGTRVFYTKNEDLYEYSLAVGAGAGTTVDLTPTGGAGVQGVAQISEDGTYVYFVAKGALAANATEQQCRNETEEEETGAEPKQENLGCNLYVSHDGVTTFVSELAARDRSDWSTPSATEYRAGPSVTSAVVSPDGEELGFTSERSLTGYDNEQSQHGQCEGVIAETEEAGSGRCREVYLYDAATHRLVCASCNPSGARPSGPASLRQLPTDDVAQYRPRNLLADGTLFFDSWDALVPNATNGRENVYEYQGGHVYPISAVAGGHESFFLDANPSGSDVFLATADDLVRQDTGGNVVVYDAREGGGVSVPRSPASCDGESSCVSAPAPQPSWLEPGVAFSGSGNVVPTATSMAVTKMSVAKTRAQLKAEKLAKALKACKKDKAKKRRATCERGARKKYGNAKAKRATSHGRAGR